jgi:hypothetical protein
MKWLPDPRLPSCSRQFGANRSGIDPVGDGLVGELRDQAHGVLAGGTLVVLPGRERDCGRDRLPQLSELPAPSQLHLGDVQPQGHHPAADVDTDRRRDDRPQGGDD